MQRSFSHSILTQHNIFFFSFWNKQILQLHTPQGEGFCLRILLLQLLILKHSLTPKGFFTHRKGPCFITVSHLGCLTFSLLNWKHGRESLELEHAPGLLRNCCCSFLLGWFWIQLGLQLLCFCFPINPHGEHLCGTFDGGGGVSPGSVFTLFVSRWFRWWYHCCVCCYPETCSCFSLLWWGEKRG